PKEQPPRKLSGKRTLAIWIHLERGTEGICFPDVPADGIILSGKATDGAFRVFLGGIIPRKIREGSRCLPQRHPPPRHLSSKRPCMRSTLRAGPGWCRSPVMTCRC